MIESLNNSTPRNLDMLGKLCFEGQEVASYLFQVPDDAAQWERIRAIVAGIIRETAATRRRELPQIAREMQEALQQPPSMQVAEALMTGFDRIIKLWKSARSGLLDAKRLNDAVDKFGAPPG